MVTAALDSCVAVEGLVVLLGALVFTLSILLVLWAFLDATLSEGKLGSGGGGSFVSLAPFGPVAIRGEAAKAVDSQPVLVKTGKGEKTLGKTLPVGTLIFDDLAAIAAELIHN